MTLVMIGRHANLQLQRSGFTRREVHHGPPSLIDDDPTLLLAYLPASRESLAARSRLPVAVGRAHPGAFIRLCLASDDGDQYALAHRRWTASS